MILPWQFNEWKKIQILRKANKLPHALLLSGESGVGKKTFSLHLAHALLCHAPNAERDACGSCKSCFLLRADTHPDLLLVEPEEDSQSIKIDQIRALIQFVNTSAMQNGNRVIVINPVGAMNINAANALLKSLEEPSDNCIFILVNHLTHRILPTIKSRCQEITFSKPDASIAMQWLKEKNQSVQEAELALALRIANQAPMQASQLLQSDFFALRTDFYKGFFELAAKKQSPLQFAAKWQDASMPWVFKLLQIGLSDILKCYSGCDAIVNTDYSDQYKRIAQSVSMHGVVRYLDIVQAYYAKILSSINFNKQLLLEDLSIQWVKYAVS